MNPSSEQEKWVFQRGSQALSSLLIVDHIGYLGDANGRFFALDLDSGQPKWTATRTHSAGATGRRVAGPTAHR